MLTHKVSLAINFLILVFSCQVRSQVLEYQLVNEVILPMGDSTVSGQFFWPSYSRINTYADLSSLNSRNVMREKVFSIDSLFNKSQQAELDKKWIAQKSIPIDQDQITSPNKLNRGVNKGFNSMSHIISYPLIQIGKNEVTYAFVFVSSSWDAGTGGNLFLKIFRQDSGKWIQIHQELVGIT